MGRNAPAAPVLELMKTAAQYAVRVEGIEFAKDIQKRMPLWLHTESDKQMRRLLHSKESRCRRDKHVVCSVNAVTMAETLDFGDHIPHNG